VSTTEGTETAARETSSKYSMGGLVEVNLGYVLSLYFLNYHMLL